jgi:NAD(P)H-dependent FMN reductase
MKIQIILGSTRPGRQVIRFGKWIAAEASKLDGAEIETVDLADYDLPFFNEPASPRYNPNRTPEVAVQKWMDKLAQADGYIFVSPEYNHSIPGVLKNAIDYITTEFEHKPAAVASYGSVGGARAAEHLKTVLLEAHAGVIPQALTVVGSPQGIMSEDGLLNADIAANPSGPSSALSSLLAELRWWTEATIAARAKE